MNNLYTCILGILFITLSISSNSQDMTGELYKLVDRIGGQGSSDKFIFSIETELKEHDKDIFIIGKEQNKIKIRANNLIAASTGLNWYLNHYLHINLSWNTDLKTDLRNVSLVFPEQEEKHQSLVKYRYYLNYCTFSYSAAFWNWERWEKEIDWMLLHGINMPLVLVGMPIVWQKILKELEYSQNEIDNFIAGPAFQAWWLMNNLEGWGGKNPQWWYDYQEDLSKKILSRMRQFNMSIVLPGYSGMVPSNISEKKGWKTTDTGLWCGFKRPVFLNSSDTNFSYMSELYYQKLKEVMGLCDFYSIDPFHEGGRTAGIDLKKAYKAIENQMIKANPKAKWLIQSWNENPRKEALESISKDKLIVLDLFSEALPKWKTGYMGHSFIFCMLNNFGGRTGLHGRINRTIEDFYSAYKHKTTQLKGIGASSEGIENNPILYDLLYELAWRENTESSSWLQEYCISRYNKENRSALLAWQILLNTVYKCQTEQQGTSEPIICARPNLEISSVSSWSTSQLYYDKKQVAQAFKFMLQAGEKLSGENYEYDLVDIGRQALSDKAEDILKNIKSHYLNKNKERLIQEEQNFLELILDIDRLLATNKGFRLSTWLNMSHKICNEAKNVRLEQRQWLEWNARLLITVWGDRKASNQGGLHDYSNRQWSGLLKDFHYKRWKIFFEAINKYNFDIDWFSIEKEWCEDFSKQYNDETKEKAYLVAKELYTKYFQNKL